MGIAHRASALIAQTLATMAPDRMASKIKNPYFFVGCGRSGTSLLAALLATHPEIAVYPYEANELWHPSFYPWEHCDLSIGPIWADPYAFTKASLARRSRRDNLRIRATFGAYQYVFRGKCFVNKSVLITFMIPQVLDLFPDARFIHIVRDGRAVALSWTLKERQKIKASIDRYQALGLALSFEALLDRFAEHWKHHIAEIEKQQALLQLKERGLLYELTYEELCTNPHEQLRQLAQYLNVDPAAFASADYSRIRNTNFKYERELSPASIERISDIMQPMLMAKKYSR